MADARFRRLQDLFAGALEIEPAERDAWIDEACVDEPTLAVELRALLARERDPARLPEPPSLQRLHDALRDAQPAVADEGRRVGAFVIDAVIGDGGMGRVYRAHRHDGEVVQQVAIKLVRAELLNPALLARFSAERRMLAALNHPNICGFIDAGTLDDGTPYVVMELVEGEPLLDYCDRRRLDLRQRVALLRKVVAAVGHAHRQLIVHRDIKSSNVLVDSRGEPRLLDFGIAKSLASALFDEHTQTAERFFTPANAAPEQLRGEPVGVGCDIYALGCLGYALLGGVAPFDFQGMRAAAIERVVLDVPPPLLSQRVRIAPAGVAAARGCGSLQALEQALRGDLDVIVATCLRKEPRERYASAEQLDQDLAAVLEQHPIRARAGDRWYRARRFAGRHRLALGLVSGLALSLLAGATAVSWLALSLAEQRDRLTVERDHAQQLVTLLKDAFTAADPARVAGEATRLGDVLASARPRMEALHDVQPAVYASLAATLAEVELGLGRDQVASELAARALAAEVENATNRRLRRSLQLTRATALTRLGDYVSAAEALQQVRDDDGVEQADWLVASGRSLGRRAQYAEAIASLERAVEALADQPPTDALANAARHELIYALLLDSDYERGLEQCDRALEWQRTALDDADPSVLRTRMYRADLLTRLKRSDEAVAEARGVREDIAAAYGRGSPTYGRANVSLASALQAAGQLDEAIDLYRQVVTVWGETLGPDHAQTIRATYNLAQYVMEKPGHADEAEQLMERALAGALVRFGAAGNSTHYMRHGLVQHQLDHGQYAAALANMVTEAAATGVDALHPVNQAARRAILQQVIERNRCAAGTASADSRHASGCAAALAALQRLPDGIADRGSKKP